jgi:hypothetical protein
MDSCHLGWLTRADETQRLRANGCHYISNQGYGDCLQTSDGHEKMESLTEGPLPRSVDWIATRSSVLRQAERKDRANADFARRFDFPAHRMSEAPADRQTKAGPTTAVGSLRLLEGLEDVIEAVRWDAAPGILDLDVDV